MSASFVFAIHLSALRSAPRFANPFHHCRHDRSLPTAPVRRASRDRPLQDPKAAVLRVIGFNSAKSGEASAGSPDSIPTTPRRSPPLPAAHVVFQCRRSAFRFSWRALRTWPGLPILPQRLTSAQPPNGPAGDRGNRSVGDQAAGRSSGRTLERRFRGATLECMAASVSGKEDG